MSLFETFLSCFEDKWKTSCNFLFARTYVILILVSSRRVTTEYVFVKLNRFRFLFWNRFGFFELSSIDKVMATGFRKCFVCGSMKNGVCFREGGSAFFYARSAEDGNSLPGLRGGPLSGQGRKPCPVNCRCDNSYWVLLVANAR